MSIIYGERIRLRAVEREDIQRFYVWVNDPDVTLHLSLYLPLSAVDEENWFDSLGKRPQAEKPLAVEIRDGDGWKLIGNCGVFDIDAVSRQAELGIMIGGKDEWDKGYGAETMALLLRHCFETLNLNRAYLRVYAGNERGKRAYEKAGFVEEGRLREAVYKRGKYDDVIVMGALRSEWIARKKER